MEKCHHIFRQALINKRYMIGSGTVLQIIKKKFITMKLHIINNSKSLVMLIAFCASLLLLPESYLAAQDNPDSTARATEVTDEPVVKKIKPVKNTFQSVWIIV